MTEPRKSIAFVNGPNLNRLGTRNPNLYGHRTLNEIADDLTAEAANLGFNLIKFQSNHEGELIDYIQSLSSQTVGIILNPGALMMAGYSLRDAIEDCNAPVIEVHISNIWSREPFRHHSVLSAVCRGVISGFGVSGYSLALKALSEICQNGDGSKMLALPRKLTTKSRVFMDSIKPDGIQVGIQAKEAKRAESRLKKKKHRLSNVVNKTNIQAKTDLKSEIEGVNRPKEKINTKTRKRNKNVKINAKNNQ